MSDHNSDNDKTATETTAPVAAQEDDEKKEEEEEQQVMTTTDDIKDNNQEEETSEIIAQDDSVEAGEHGADRIKDEHDTGPTESQDEKQDLESQKPAAVAPTSNNIIVGVGVITFHHSRGPEIEYWIGEGGEEKAKSWPHLPFQCLPDGSHSREEDYSYFTLADTDKDGKPYTTLFGISCCRQIKASALANKDPEITRSTVQKAVVIIARKPIFGPLREKLAVVTQAYFLQGDFQDRSIIDILYDNLRHLFPRDIDETEVYIGMTVRILIHRLRWRALVLFKAMLLQPRILFFSSNTELLCEVQFSLVSLIPGLVEHLEDCGAFSLDNFEKHLKRPTSLKTSERSSLLAYVGLPLQPFGKGSIFAPYMPLQQLDDLKEPSAKSYIVGSTNSLLLTHKRQHADILVNLDTDTVEILNHNLEAPLALTTPDRRWIDHLTFTVAESWDENDPTRPKLSGFTASDDDIRLQFEDYLMGMLSCEKYSQFLTRQKSSTEPEPLLDDVVGDPIVEYGTEFINQWSKSDNFRLWSKVADPELFDIVQPSHIASGRLSLTDVQQRVNNKIQDLHLDGKVAPAKQVFTRTTQRMGSVFGSLWATEKQSIEHHHHHHHDDDDKQDGQELDKKGEDGDHHHRGSNSSATQELSTIESSETLENASPSSSAAAGGGGGAAAYFQSWSKWASDKRKVGFGRRSSTKGNGNDEQQDQPPPIVVRESHDKIRPKPISSGESSSQDELPPALPSRPSRDQQQEDVPPRLPLRPSARNSPTLGSPSTPVSQRRPALPPRSAGGLRESEYGIDEYSIDQQQQQQQAPPDVASPTPSNRTLRTFALSPSTSINSDNNSGSTTTATTGSSGHGRNRSLQIVPGLVHHGSPADSGKGKGLRSFALGQQQSNGDEDKNKEQNNGITSTSTSNTASVISDKPIQDIPVSRDTLSDKPQEFSSSKLEPAADIVASKPNEPEPAEETKPNEPEPAEHTYNSSNENPANENEEEEDYEMPGGFS